MKSMRVSKWALVGGGLLWAVLSAEAQTSNTYINTTASGFWDASGNWSAGVAPSNNFALISITNAPSKVVVIDSTTASGFPGTLTISNLLVAGTGGTNTVRVTNTAINPPLRVLNSFTLSAGSHLDLRHGIVQVDGLDGGVFSVNSTTSTGVVVGVEASFPAPLLVTTNAATRIGHTGPGMLTLLRGAWQATDVFVGSASAQGTLTINGGTNTLFGPLTAGAAGTGTVWLTGGELIATNLGATITLGDNGVGQMNISNGLCQLAQGLTVGFGRSGTLTMAGGTVTNARWLTLGSLAGSTGTVWITGGALIVSNSLVNTEIAVGFNGVGRMTVSNGTIQATSVQVAYQGGTQGTLTLAGGTMDMLGDLGVGGTAIAATGTLWLTGGRLVTTNDTTRIGFGGPGRFSVSNGVWLANDVALARGTLTIAGGTNALIGPLIVGNGGLTGAVWITGGQLVVTNRPGSVGTGSGFVVDGSVMVDTGCSISVSNGNTIVGNAGAGSLALSGPLTITAGNLTLGSLANSTGMISMDASGSILVTNVGSSLFIGGAGRGSLATVGGTLRTSSLIAGNVGVGTLTTEGTTVSVLSTFSIGESTGSTGTVFVVGGTLVATNSSQFIGNLGVGAMFVYGGTVQFNRLLLGQSRVGTLTIAGGTTSVAGEFRIGTVRGEVSVNSGWLVASTNVAIAPFPNAAGTLTVVGGTNTIYHSLTLGNFTCNGTATVVVAGGALTVTNATANAVLDIRSGTLTFSSGTLATDRLVITNACGRFIHTGGTLLTGTNIISGALDADGDGMPNQFEMDHGLDEFNPADAGNDNDGDGQNNLAEFLAGTDATNSASFFGITSITQVSTNIQINWTIGADKTNALERTAGAGGSFSNNFSAIFIATNTTVATPTNYLDVGAANLSNLYYRIRLVP